MNTFKLIKSDYNRYIATGAKSRLKLCLFNQGFLATIIFRLNSGLFYATRKIFLINKLVSLICLINLKFSQIFTGISIPVGTKIKKGLYISHTGTIIINSSVEIGENCNLAPMIVIGWGKFQKKYGVPKIGNNVWIGPGAKIFGPIYIGNNVAIGANSVINKSIPNDAVVVGHNKIVNYNSSKEYIKV